MEYSAEERFARSFIRKRFRERLLYELTTPKMRYKGLDRFCHQSGELLDPDKIIMEDSNLENSARFRDFMKEHAGQCVMLSPDQALDGRTLPLREAVAYAARGLDAVIILGDDYAVVFAEAVKGGRGKYLLCE